mmetsp:Transcript_40248/g.49035  ORF Transcript_40248/g.49035 Transcript_40248/m.49035 type:complete len:307 (-) Transcript_40248:101-1021(-)
MSFLGLVAMNSANISVNYTLKPTTHDDPNTKPSSTQDRNQDFYDGAMTVLFDLPNGIVVSTYVLLTLVWAECFLLARWHTENSLRWRKGWLLAYTVFNAGLYGTQMVLYFLIFWSGTNAVARTVLYGFTTGINFLAVVLVFVLYVVLTVRFSGFPYRSEHARLSLGKISILMLIWSVARLLWAITALVSYVFNVDLLRDARSLLSALGIFAFFMVCEIVPIIAMLDYSYMTLLGFERVGIERDTSASGPSESERYPCDYSNPLLDDADGLDVKDDWQGGAPVEVYVANLPPGDGENRLLLPGHTLN